MANSNGQKEPQDKSAPEPANDGANHDAAIVCATALDAPHKSYVDTRVKQREAFHTLLQAELGLKMVPTTRPPSFMPRLWMRQ